MIDLGDIYEGPFDCPVKRCARCGEDHESVHFELLAIPSITDNGSIFASHWGRCPNTDQPILNLATGKAE